MTYDKPNIAMQNASNTHLVGEAMITRVDETTFALAPDVLFPDWDAASGQALGERFSSASLDLTNRRVTLKTHLWVVQISGLTIVVDTGIGNGKTRPFSALFDKLDNPVLERFEAAGLRREQVDYVLLTHLHVDHVGWNTHWQNDRWTPVFPNATYIFGERECDYFATPEGEPRRMVFEDSILPLIDAQQARVVSDEGEEIVDGIRFLPTPGHSIGHMAIEIRSRGQTALFSGDVMHSPCRSIVLSGIQPSALISHRREHQDNRSSNMRRQRVRSYSPRTFRKHLAVRCTKVQTASNGTT